MPKTIQIRDVDDAVYGRLAELAALRGVSVPELLRAEATRLAARPSFEEWLARVGRRESPLLTMDARLVRATGPRCPIEVLGA